MNMNFKDCRTDQVISLGYDYPKPIPNLDYMLGVKIYDTPQPPCPNFADVNDAGTYIILGPDECMLPDEVEEFYSREEAETYAETLATTFVGCEFLVFKLVTSVIAEPAETILTFHA